jgi:hypothetical protein
VRKRGFGVIKNRGGTSTTANPKALLLPNTIFFDDKLAILEAIIQYLKDEKGLSYKEIGDLLERDQRNVWTVYSRVKKKGPRKPVSGKPSLFVPITILTDRSISGFEAIVEFLKESKGLSFHDIGIMLNRDERNVWTVYHRAKAKRGKHGQPK